MTCSLSREAKSFYLRNKKPSEQTNTLSHWAWAHDHCSYWKALLNAGSVPRYLLLLWRGPMHFSWHNMLNMEGGGVTSRYIKNHISLSLMFTARISVMVLLLCPEKRFGLLASLLSVSLMVWAAHFNCSERNSQLSAVRWMISPVFNNTSKWCTTNQHLQHQTGNLFTLFHFSRWWYPFSCLQMFIPSKTWHSTMPF